MEFNVVNEDNKIKIGNVISIFKIPESDREIALLSLGDFDTDTSSLHVAYLNKDNEGYDYISEIDNDLILKKAMLVVKDMMEIINNG